MKQTLKKLLKMSLFLTIIVIAFVVGQSLGSQVSSRNIYLDDLPSDAFFVINTDGTNYWATRYDGKIPSGMSGTDGIKVINFALSNLTSSRTWKEKIVIKGKIEIKDASQLPIKIPDYTIIQIQGLLLHNDASSKVENFFENSDSTNGNKHIEVIGGIINQQRGTEAYSVSGGDYTHTGCGILFEKVTDFLIKDIYFLNCAGSSVSIADSVRGKLENIKTDNCCGLGVFEYTNATYITAQGCHARNGGATWSSGWDWCADSGQLDFIDCHAFNMQSIGFMDENNVDLGTRFVDCSSIGNAKDGFHVDLGSILINCEAKNNGDSGVFAYEGITIIGGRFFDDQTTKTQDYGIEISNSFGDNVVVIGADCRGNADATLDITFPNKETSIYSQCLGRVKNKGVITPPSVPTSGVAQKNVYSVSMDVYVSGGTVTNIAINGTSVGLTSGHFHLEPNDTITITYSASPTWVWIGE